VRQDSTHQTARLFPLFLVALRIKAHFGFEMTTTFVRGNFEQRLHTWVVPFFVVLFFPFVILAGLSTMKVFSLVVVLLAFSAGVRACDRVYVFQRNVGTVGTQQRTNIINAIIAANSAGAELCWSLSDYTSNQLTLVNALNEGKVSFLLGLNPDNGSPIWSAGTKAAVSNALSNDLLQKLAVFDRFVNFDAQMPGLEAGQVVRDFLFNPDFIDAVSPADRPIIGPAGIVSSSRGCSSNHGYIRNPPAFDADHQVQFYRRGNNNAVSVQYCFANKVTYYSTTPMDFYLIGFSCDSPSGSARNLFKNTITKLALDTCNQPPTCPSVVASASWLPPNNKSVSVDVSAYQSAPKNNVSVQEITSCQSSKAHTPRFGRDCVIDVNAALGVKVQAKRHGNGNGQLYKISYHAIDNVGQSCSGDAYVCNNALLHE
jgi:hypothetical protein